MFELNQLKNVSLLLRSKVINTEPVGQVDQKDFLNCIVKIETEIKPQNLLLKLQIIENKMGRKREIKGGPRIIDLDILFYNSDKIEGKNLIIPHPEILNREFILYLMSIIEPNFFHPTIKMSMKNLYDNYKN